jgi:hypothetical protein
VIWGFPRAVGLEDRESVYLMGTEFDSREKSSGDNHGGGCTTVLNATVHL